MKIKENVRVKDQRRKVELSNHYVLHLKQNNIVYQLNSNKNDKKER